MLRHQTQPKIAAPMRPVQPAQAPAMQTEGSLSKTLPALTEIGEHNLATKQDLQRWMHELQDLIAKDISTIKAEVRQNTDRVHAVEESVSTIGNEITHLKETLYTMQTAHQALAVQVSTQGDHLRRNHIKLREAPAAITQASFSKEAPGHNPATSSCPKNHTGVLISTAGGAQLTTHRSTRHHPMLRHDTG
ncbi:Hypothetical predicted protein [Pelobates cultripes]|uniref:Uncharacterized protein n=1 Tax=Pelobates cultripes TaxID=61616 RepID=A0AAD1W3E9_PELCU|nr:Hypothetical predicted protein [Pelobates cultripes]